jgi:hypothetical protein
MLMAYLDDKVNSYRDQDVRRALYPIAAMAERTGCTVAMLRHFTKGGGTNAVYRGGGSIGIIGAARAGFMCGKDPDDESGERRVFAKTKLNIAAEPPSLAYRLVPDELHGCARVQWEGTSEHKASALLAEADGDDPGDLELATDWLRAYLTENGDTAGSAVQRASLGVPIAPRTLRRARERLGVQTKPGGFQQPWLWHLPPHVTEGSGHQSGPESVSDRQSGPVSVELANSGDSGADLGKREDDFGQLWRDQARLFSQVTPDFPELANLGDMGNSADSGGKSAALAPWNVTGSDARRSAPPGERTCPRHATKWGRRKGCPECDAANEPAKVPAVNGWGALA